MVTTVTVLFLPRLAIIAIGAIHAMFAHVTCTLREDSSGIFDKFELIDRILDKGLVIDAYVSITVIGIPLVVIRARIVVASVETFLRYADAMGLRGEPGEKVQQQQQQPQAEQQQQDYWMPPPQQRQPMQQQGYISP
jgi:gas vesicle structural protein